MNKRTKIITGFVAASSIALAVPFIAHARPGGEGFGGDCGMRGERMGYEGMHGGKHGRGLMRQLDLTEEQRDQMFELRHALAPKMREEMKAVRAASQSLRDMAQKGEYDEATVKQLTEARAAAMSRMAQLRARNQNDIYQLLSPEQRTQFQALRAQQQGRFGERGHPRGGHRMGWGMDG